MEDVSVKIKHDGQHMISTKVEHWIYGGKVIILVLYTKYNKRIFLS